MGALTAGATAALIAGGVAAAAGATTSGIAAKRAKDAKSTAQGEANTHQQQLDAMIANRPSFKNPYENLTNQFENLDNPYANMTVATEAALAKEAMIPYAVIAMSTDYDCWKEDEAMPVWQDILAIFNKNVDNVKKILLETIHQISKQKGAQ